MPAYRTRHFWHQKIEAAWKQRSIIWLSGVRRAGKTILAQSLPGVEYFDCELPRIRQSMADPEGFLAGLGKRTVVLDEVHRLPDPSELLKIAADHFPNVRLIATGSSTLGASAKFRDTLTGRKSTVWLTPMVLQDLSDFANTDINHRMLHGGLPPFFLSRSLPERDFQEWMDSYWAKDIIELFRLERRPSFQRFVELVMAQSGGIFEATRFTGPCEVSRPTIATYLSVLESTYVAHVLKPFNSRQSTEIVSAPKVYGLDTGFVACFRGWRSLRREDMGYLWEHFVLNELHANLQTREIRYWRDKHGHEIDLILIRRGKPPAAIECKWSAQHYEANSLQSFRKRYIDGENFVVCQDVAVPYLRTYGSVTVRFVGLADLVRSIERASD